MWQSNITFSVTGNIGDELRYACLHNDVETVRRLCKLNVNIEIEDNHCTTPLMLACYYGNYDVVNELVTNQNVLIDHGDINDVKPIHYATEQQHINIVKLLIDNNCSLNSQTKNGWTALHYAADVANFDLIKLLLLNHADKTIKDNYDQTPFHIASKKKIADIICLFQSQSNEEIRNLISNNSTSHHRNNSSSLNKHHNENHQQRNNNYSLELEKERIMRGEISTLKDKINEIQFCNDKLLKRVGSVEDYVQGLSVSVHSILSLSPIHSQNKTTTNISSPPLNNPQLAISSSIPRITVPKPTTNNRSDTKENKVIIKNKNLTKSLETPMTELATPIIQEKENIINIQDEDEEDEDDDNELNGGEVEMMSDNEIDIPQTDIDRLQTMDTLDIGLSSGKEADNETGTIGLGTEYDFDLEDEECKNHRPDLAKMPSLRPEANSLELGGDSDYGKYSDGKYSKASTPHLPTITSPLTNEFDQMTPIHEEILQIANERNSNHTLSANKNNNNNSSQQHNNNDNNNNNNNNDDKNKNRLNLSKNKSLSNNNNNTQFDFGQHLSSADTTPLPSDGTQLVGRYRSSPQTNHGKFLGKQSPIDPSPSVSSPSMDIRYQTYEYNRYTPTKSNANDHNRDHRRGQSQQLFPHQYHGYNQNNNNNNNNYVSGYHHTYHQYNANAQFINQYMKQNKMEYGVKSRSYGTMETENDDTPQNIHESIFPDTDIPNRNNITNRNKTGNISNSMPPSRRKSTQQNLAPHINDDDDEDDDNQNYPDLDDIRMVSQEIISMDEDEDDDEDDNDDDIDDGHEGQEVVITEEEYVKLMGINSNSSIGNTPSPPMRPKAKANRGNSDPVPPNNDPLSKSMGSMQNKSSMVQKNKNRRGFASANDSPNNTFVRVNNSKLDIPLSMDYNSGGIPSTIGMIGAVSTGTISPNTVDAVSRATKHHEEMTNLNKSSFYGGRKSKLPTIELNAKKLRNRTQSADSPGAAYYGQLFKHDNPSSITNKSTKSKKRKILLSKNMTMTANNRNINSKNGKSGKRRSLKQQQPKLMSGVTKHSSLSPTSWKEASSSPTIPFNKQNVNITPPPPQTRYNNNNNNNNDIINDSSSPYDLNIRSPYHSDKKIKKLYNDINTNDSRKTNYSNLKNRRTNHKKKSNINHINNNNKKKNNEISQSRAASAATSTFRRKKKKSKKKTFKKISSYIDDY